MSPATGHGRPDLGPPDVRRRLAARAIDVVTVLTWIWALSVVRVMFHLRWSDDIAPAPWGKAFLLAITFVVVYSVYEVAFISRAGATPGKDLMRIKVLDAETGENPTTAQAALRTIPLAAVWLLPPMWLGIPLTVLLVSIRVTDAGRYRTIPDVLGSTRVVHQPDLEPEPGTTIEEAEEERRGHFMPRLVDPIHLLPSQIFRHPGVPRSGGRGRSDQEPPER